MTEQQIKRYLEIIIEVSQDKCIIMSQEDKEIYVMGGRHFTELTRE